MKQRARGLRRDDLTRPPPCQSFDLQLNTNENEVNPMKVSFPPHIFPHGEDEEYR